jgi:uncharacterized protein with von Willebrand factor type A (vWA) domain
VSESLPAAPLRALNRPARLHARSHLSTIAESVAKAPDEAVSSWDYAKMGDEELEQLQEAYQKLNVPIPHTLSKRNSKTRTCSSL